MASIDGSEPGTSKTNNENGKKRKSAMVDENEPPEKRQNLYLLKTIESLYLNTKGADVYFTFDSSDEEVPAHRIVLAVSPVFDTAFFGSIPEKKKVKITDASVDAFKIFLQFFYLKEMKLSMELIKDVMHLCDKYQCDECMEVCSTFLKKNITTDELCMGYQLAIHYKQTDLVEFFQRKISLDAEEVVKSEGFLMQ